jgi:hypothetical protein
MRKALLVVVVALAFDAMAQSGARARPPGTLPLEEVPPPPAIVDKDAALEPDVKVRMEGDQKIEEYRVKGKLFMMRVTPKNGPAYVLMDHSGDGTFMKQDHTIDGGVRVPQWVLVEF